MIKVELSMVVFLLDNLYWKVFSALTTFGGKKGPHSKFAHYDSDMGPSPAELIKLVISLLPSLCQYVEASSSYFQVSTHMYCTAVYRCVHSNCTTGVAVCIQTAMQVWLCAFKLHYSVAVCIQTALQCGRVHSNCTTVWLCAFKLHYRCGCVHSNCTTGVAVCIQIALQVWPCAFKLHYRCGCVHSNCTTGVAVCIQTALQVRPCTYCAVCTYIQTVFF